MAADVQQFVGPTQKSSSTSHTMDIDGVAEGNSVWVAVSYFCGTVNISINVDDGTNSYTLRTRSDPGELDTIVTRTWLAEDVAAGDYTITVSSATAFIPTITVVEVDGVDAACFEDGDYGVESGTAPNTNEVTATTNCLALAAMTHNGSSLTIGEGSGWTLVGENENTSSTMPQSIIKRSVAAGGVTADWTLSGAAAAYMGIVLVKDAAVAGNSIPVLMNLMRQFRA